MNQDAFDNLSDVDRTALGKVFGENLSRAAGKAWDKIDTAGLVALNANSDNNLTEASAGDATKWQAMTGPLITKVIAEVSAKGVDATAVHAFIKEQMAAE
ncbi:MAG: C4-dicarboxylate ABC transporter substrate-binding protein, partial [Planktomarina sp.]|nr:C4-dicarboxylate ABC transporter substrate-binding protein [Planktomarina sp.]